MTYIAYHSKLETSFLMDEFALPPPAPDENEISLVDMSPQKEVLSGTGEDSAKEQSTVKRETTDFVFSSMHSSIVSQILNILSRPRVGPFPVDVAWRTEE